MQQEFAKALWDADMPVPDGIVGPDGKPSVKRFNVYRNNVVASLIDVLAGAYPTVQKIIGDNNFGVLAKSYVKTHPPESPMMFEYGHDFADFVDGFAPVKGLTYLADVARLESARRRSYHAADAPCNGHEKLGKIAPEKLANACIVLHPSVRLVRSTHPIFSIWRFNNIGPEKITAPQENVLVARPQATVEMRVVNHPMYVFLSALGDHQPLAMAAELAVTADEDFDLAGALGEVLQAKLVTDVET